MCGLHNSWAINTQRKRILMSNDKARNLQTTKVTVKNLLSFSSKMAAKGHDVCKVWIGLFNSAFLNTRMSKMRYLSYFNLEKNQSTDGS